MRISKDMYTFKSSFSSRLLCYFLAAVCFFFVISNTGYGVVNAEPADGDLVFDNSIDESKLISHDNKHTISRRTSNHNSKPSQADEEDSWLTSAVKRIKRQWDFSWFNNHDTNNTSRERRDSQEHQSNQQTQHQEADDADNEIDDNNDDDDDDDELVHHTNNEHIGQHDVDSDDEDAFGGESGEGSAETPLPPVTHQGLPVYFRITLTIFEPFVEGYTNRNSPQFQELSKNLARAVDDLYESLPGQQSATLINVQKRQADSFSSKVTLDLGSVDYYEEDKIKDHLYSHIQKFHSLGPYRVSTDEFSFRPFEGVTEVDVKPTTYETTTSDRISGHRETTTGQNYPTHDTRTTYPARTTESVLTIEPSRTETPYTESPRPHITPQSTWPTPTEAPHTETPRTHSTFTDTPKTETPYIPYETTTHREGTTYRYHHTIPDKDFPTRRPTSRCRADDTLPCADGRSTICAVQKCDGTPDCPDGDDEKDCHAACAEGEFSCDISRCIPISQRCDGAQQCVDRTDELECEPQQCRPGQFRCNNGHCIEGYLRCNQQEDCTTGEDEADCPTRGCHPQQQFRCGNGKCISIAARCDRKYDCQDQSDEKNCPCKSNDFHCTNGFCIPQTQRCDGIRHCQDGSDEQNCTTTGPCLYHQFQCIDGTCIDKKLRCNRQLDCADHSDEIGCSECRNDQYRCKNGVCISISQRCDGIPNCSQNEDEEFCAVCPLSEKKCANGDCINASKFCDGRIDCSDGSDELACNACAQDQFQCTSNKKCISKNFRCDRFEDCNDGSDEEGCSPQTGCQAGEFDCGDGNCIQESKKCDGIPNCSNGLDEFDCGTPPPKVCATNEHRCNDGSCIPSYYVCDGTPHCRDGSDEEECGCKQDEFQCSNGACIPQYLRCDRHRDCSDGSDEHNCGTERPVTETEAPPTPRPTPKPTPATPPPYSCPWGHKPCSTGQQCFPVTSFCDGRFDCNDLSDETNCAPSSGGLDLKTYPSQQTIKESREVVFQCRDEGLLRAKVQWLRGNGLPLPPGSRDRNGRLEIPNIQLEHSGAYICAAIGYPPSTPGAQLHVYLTVEPYTPPPTRPPAACDLHEATCANGDCIPKNLVCDGKFDCKDGSDETRCSAHGCEPNQFRCANKRCVLKSWHCDGDDDCGDNTDEANCATNPPGSPCQFTEFACHSGNQCIPKSFHCDHQRDCNDGSDEVGCSNVYVAKPPPPMVNLKTGDVFIITCTAVGVPTPEVVWRLNWGHIPEKCTTTSVNGVGTLTCPDIQVEDQGAYSCEALNVRGSVFAIPDTILVVEGLPPVCPKGTFNDDARTANDCISCFCFGHATECRSADLYTYHLQPPFDSLKSVGVHVDPYRGTVNIKSEPTYRSEIRITPLGRNGLHSQLPSTDSIEPGIVPYFAIPENYHGNQLKSYGGWLKYQLRYEGYGQPVNAPDVILTGNGYTLLHVGKPHAPGREEEVSVRFFAGEWVKRSESGPETRATREEIMMVLENVESILIKLQYVTGQLDTSLSNVQMDSAGISNVGLGEAAFVEECRCPVGYSGLSCERCSDGYSHHRSGPWLGQCYKQPKVCEPGTYGDPESGIPCKRCPCPLTSPTNQFAQTCQLGSDGEVVCNCQPGYTGKRCEQCEAGYTGNPLIPGDSCRPGSICNPDGSQSPYGDDRGNCRCKQNTAGPTCNECKPNTFHISRDNQFGCIACFCMGITEHCTSSYLYRDTIGTAFSSSKNDFKLVESLKKEAPIDEGIRLDQNAREIVYSEFSNRGSDAYYWSLPSRYLGDKLTSYGGYLRYSLRYVPLPGGQSSRNTAPDVELISDNHINLIYFGREQPQPNSNQSFSVPLLEQYWQRTDGQKADREHLLMTLADLKAVLIKATYTTNTREAALISVSLDTAGERNTGRERALSVEQCSCPPGYKGLSCEDCDVGYSRAPEGLYLGLCEPCSCNGRSQECDSETGECLNCRDHSTGQHCELCLPGFALDPASGGCRWDGGSSHCECDTRGAVSRQCRGGVCECKPNVEGHLCNQCRPGTFGLNATNPDGCQECFCSGVTEQCTESSLYKEQLPSRVLDEQNHGYSLTDQTQRQRIADGFNIDISQNRIGYTFRPGSPLRFYWSLPSEFTGNQIKSYGGWLEFTQQYSTADPYRSSYTPDQDVIIIGNGITIFWRNPTPVPSNRPNKISVHLSTSADWQRLDYRQGPRPASHEDILIVLANINSILVRATLSQDTTTSYISDITLDTAVEKYTSQGRAKDVETCRCPPGYGGTSCEICDAGFYRDVNDLQTGPLGSCTRCPCSGNERSCELGPDSRVVCYCRSGYSGSRCEETGEVTTTPWPTQPPPPPPRIEVTIPGPAIQIVQIGQTVRLRCSATSSSPNLPIRLSWQREGGHIEPDHQVDDGTGYLVITDVRISDAGIYLCQASSEYTVVTGRVTIVVNQGNQPTPPRVQVTPSSIEVYVGQPVEIQCVAEGNPLPNIQWVREGQQALTRSGIFIGGSLRITSAQLSDSGRYECIASNTQGVARSVTDIRVIQEPFPSVTVTISPESYYGKTGDKFSLVCLGPQVQGQLSYVWSRSDGQPLPYTATQNPDRNILTIYNADPSDSGAYVCSVTSSTGIRGQQSCSVQITTTSVPTEYPKVTVEHERLVIPQGGSAEIRCDATGSPAPTIKWTRHPESFGPNVQQIGNVLHFQNVQVRDRGIYICVGVNSVGMSQASTFVEIERREVPVIDIQPHRAQTVVAGGSLVMQCRTSAGIPSPTVVWSRPDGQPISASVEQLSNGVLRFTGITIAEAGEYTCTAENVAGKTTAVGHVEVHTLPVLTITPRSGTITVRKNQYIKLECKAHGVPQPTVQWSKQLNRGYSGSSFHSGVDELTSARDNVAVYEITTVTTADQGYYTCQGRNAAGVTEDRVALVVEDYPTRGDIPGEDDIAGHTEAPYPPYVTPRTTNPPVTYPPYIPPRPNVKDNERTPTTDKTYTAPVGTRAELRCQTSSPAGLDPLYVNWVRGDNSTLPENSVISNGILYIDNVQPTDSGEYRCIGIHPSGAIVFSLSAHLNVVSPPRITLNPPRQIVKPGDNAYILCDATGEQPITIRWSAINRDMPQSAFARDGHLQFRGIQISDAGRYRCTAINSAGEADAVADVVVQDNAGPSITAEKKEQSAVIGSSLVLHCIVRGGNEQPSPSVRWFREHLPLSRNSQIRGEYLQIADIQSSDEGRYFCEVATEGGTASDYIDVRVEPHKSSSKSSGSSHESGNGSLDIQPSQPVTQVGDTVDLICRSNEPGVITTWSKVNGQFARNIQTSGGTLRINTATRENNGIYRCEARGHHGVYQKDYSFEVVGDDSSYENVQDEQPVETKTVPQGSPVRMECKTSLEEPVSYVWSKPGGVLPKEININNKAIQIDDVKGSDAGTYVCSASNDRSNIDVPLILIVTGIVPYFAQAPNSYIALPTLPDAYIQFNFEISFKPEMQDGLILYNGHRKSTAKGDFISLTLVGGVPQFRFNLGQGVTILKGDKALTTGKWHTIKISRNRKRATMYVDGAGPFTTLADGKFLGLDLTEPLYLGGVPNFKDIAPETQIDTGFVGCISRLKIGHLHQDIIRDASAKEGITTCETCSESPCHNQGVCQEALTNEGYMCICPVGFSGPTCSKRGGEACTPYACGPGRCIDTDDSFKCLCPLGRAGRRCENEVTVYEPGFARDAYIAYPTPKPQRRLKVSLKFKPKDLSDGILLYCAESEEGHGDFASLAIKDRHVEFRFDVGSEPIIVRSERELPTGEWIAVTASKFLNEGRLLVNGDAPITERVTGNHKALNLHTPLYVGGVDKQRVSINHGVGVHNGFNGCISEISVSGLDLNIIQSVTDSANVEDCSTVESQDSNEKNNEVALHYDGPQKFYNNKQNSCSNSPCHNDGLCQSLSKTEYKCTCINGYSGLTCEISPNLCEYLKPCQNGGSCDGDTTSYICNCPIGFIGTNCEQRAELRNEVHFSGNSYIELSKSLLSHEDASENEVIAFELATNSTNGLIFWHGQKPNEDGYGQDYIALAVSNGFLEYSFDLGSGPAIIYNNDIRINDGDRHRVILKRNGKWGSIEVDNDYTKQGEADGAVDAMNCNGNIYLGGTPNNSLMTGGKYTHGFKGCIYGFELQDSRTIDIGAKALYGVNVRPCSSLDDDVISVYEKTTKAFKYK